MYYGSCARPHAAENQVAIAAAGAIDYLVEMLRSRTDEVRSRAAEALHNLAINSAYGRGARATRGVVGVKFHVLANRLAFDWLARSNAVCWCGLPGIFHKSIIGCVVK